MRRKMKGIKIYKKNCKQDTKKKKKKKKSRLDIKGDNEKKMANQFFN